MAEGAVNPEIKRLLSEAMQSLFALPAHRVMILPRKAGRNMTTIYVRFKSILTFGLIVFCLSFCGFRFML